MPAIVQRMFVLAHLSDPHLPLPPARLSELLNKRATGWFNWWRRRHKLHRPETLAALLADLKAQGADHIAVTGDLVNIALAAEFPPARRWLEALGGAADVTLVPGNHDTYVRAARDWPRRYWGDYMRGDDGGEDFPFLRRRGPLALIGLSTAVPTPPVMATGVVGADQLARLAAMLRRLAAEPVFRVVLIHHPPLPTPGRHHKRLVDADALRTVLAAHGAALVLYGHDHRHALHWLDGPTAPMAAVEAPSASASPHVAEVPAAYNLYRIDGEPGAWRCEMETRGFPAGGNTLIALNRQRLC